MEREQTRIEPMLQAALPAGVWSARVPIRFGHCDTAGIVYTPRYFEMLNEVIEQFFVECLGIDYYELLGVRRIGLGYAQAACDFFKPNRMGEVLDAAVLVDHIGRSSYTLVLPMFKDGVEVVRGRFVTVITAIDLAQAIPIPDDVKSGLEGYRARNLGDVFGSRE